MTREEAKHIVDVAFIVPQAVRRDGEDRTYHEDEIREAKNMAIQALSQEPCEDIAQERYKDLCEYFGGAKDILKSREDFKAWLGRVKWHIHKAEELYEKYEYKKEPCDDAISRDELLKAIDTWDKFGYTETGCFVREPKGDYVPYIHYDDVIKSIKGIPSVTQKSGKWITKEAYSEDKAMGITEQIVCSNCDMQNSYFSEWDECKNPIAKTFRRSKFCPNCGAKMESEE